MKSSILKYRPEVDGLRAIAVGAVIIYHAQIRILEKLLLPGGFLGVDIFFVISGYLITYLIFKEKISTNNFLKKNFPEFSLKFCYKLKKSILQNKISFPIFSKKNIGSGNKNYNKINNLKELKEINLKSDYIIQEYLEEKYEEYTSAIIRIDSVKKVLIFKRKIHPWVTLIMLKLLVIKY